MSNVPPAFPAEVVDEIVGLKILWYRGQGVSTDKIAELINSRHPEPNHRYTRHTASQVVQLFVDEYEKLKTGREIFNESRTFLNPREVDFLIGRHLRGRPTTMDQFVNPLYITNADLDSQSKQNRARIRKVHSTYAQNQVSGSKDPAPPQARQLAHDEGRGVTTGGAYGLSSVRRNVGQATGHLPFIPHVQGPVSSFKPSGVSQGPGPESTWEPHEIQRYAAQIRAPAAGTSQIKEVRAVRAQNMPPDSAGLPGKLIAPKPASHAPSQPQTSYSTTSHTSDRATEGRESSRHRLRFPPPKPTQHVIHEPSHPPRRQAYGLPRSDFSHDLYAEEEEVYDVSRVSSSATHGTRGQLNLPSVTKNMENMQLHTASLPPIQVSNPPPPNPYEPWVQQSLERARLARAQEEELARPRTLAAQQSEYLDPTSARDKRTHESSTPPSKSSDTSSKGDHKHKGKKLQHHPRGSGSGKNH